MHSKLVQENLRRFSVTYEHHYKKAKERVIKLGDKVFMLFPLSSENLI